MRHLSTQIATAVSGVLRVLAIGTPIAQGVALTALAQSAEPAGPTVSIPAQPLGQALAALAFAADALRADVIYPIETTLR